LYQKCVAASWARVRRSARLGNADAIAYGVLSLVLDEPTYATRCSSGIDGRIIAARCTLSRCVVLRDFKGGEMNSDEANHFQLLSLDK
jgi:hypothetical protein